MKKNKKVIIILGCILLFVVLIIVSYMIFGGKNTNIIIYLDNNISLNKDEIYADGKMKNIEDIVHLVDNKLLKDYYKKEYNSQELNNKANERLNELKTSFNDSFEKDKEKILGTKSEEEFLENFKINELKTKLVEEYYKNSITGKQINTYKFNYSKSINVLSLFFKTPIMNRSEEDKANAEAATRIMEELKESKNPYELMLQYSNTYHSEVTNINMGDVNFVIDFKKELFKTSDNSLFEGLIQNVDGLYIFYRIGEVEEDDLTDDQIKDNIYNNEVKNREIYYYARALDYLKNKYNIKINDDNIKAAYEEYTNKLIKDEKSKLK